MSLTALPRPSLTPISTLAARLGVTTRTLRHYEALGLVTAQRQGQARAYDEAEIQRLELIVALRSADVPLIVVADILDAEDNPHGQARRALGAIEAALERAHRMVERLETARSAAREGLPGLRRMACAHGQAGRR